METLTDTLRKLNLAIFLLLGVLFCALITPASLAYADNESHSLGSGDQWISGLEISPASRQLTLDPGAVYKDIISVRNAGTATLEYEVKIEPFQVKYDENSNEYVGDYSSKNAYTQITNWITIDNPTGEIEPNQSIEINYSINVPTDAPGGGQYAAIFVSGQNKDQGMGTVNAVKSPGLVIIAKVNGQTREAGEILDVSIPDFLLAPPITAAVRVSNTGNIDQDVKVVMKVENYFSGSEIYSNLDNPIKKTILPETADRRVELAATTSPRLGLYKVTLTTDYIDESKINTSLVFICPLWLIAILLIMLGIIIFSAVLKLTARKRSRRNSRNNSGSSEKMSI